MRSVLLVVALDPEVLERATVLAIELDCECIVADPGGWRALAGGRLALLVDRGGLALADGGMSRSRPVRADFGDRALLYRLQRAGPRSESLGRALGLGGRHGLLVVDATAGWGRDSAVLGALGCNVVMIERHPVVRLLLADALMRAAASEDAAVCALAARLSLVGADARDVLRRWRDPPPDAILLDPMFPDRGGSAAPRKEMHLFQELVGDDGDAADLLEAALLLARHRVVVKRPLRAATLPGPRPAHAITGRSTRLDVYVLRSFGRGA